MLVFIAVSAQARPPTEQEDHKGMLCLPSARVWVHITQVRMVLRWPPLGERQITTACCDQGCRAEA